MQEAVGATACASVAFLLPSLCHLSLLSSSSSSSSPFGWLLQWEAIVDLAVMGGGTYAVMSGVADLAVKLAQ